LRRAIHIGSGKRLRFADAPPQPRTLRQVQGYRRGVRRAPRTVGKQTSLARPPPCAPGRPVQIIVGSRWRTKISSLRQRSCPVGLERWLFPRKIALGCPSRLDQTVPRLAPRTAPSSTLSPLRRAPSARRRLNCASPQHLGSPCARLVGTVRRRYAVFTIAEYRLRTHRMRRRVVPRMRAPHGAWGRPSWSLTSNRACAWASLLSSSSCGRAPVSLRRFVYSFSSWGRSSKVFYPRVVATPGEIPRP
jgi:hypothetical protein